MNVSSRRRRAHRLLVSSTIALALIVGPAEVVPSRAAAGDNVLFIVVDDLNDWVGALGGHPQAVTPNIDALASRGFLFTSAHASAPGCNPSRASILTGLAPTTTGIYDNAAQLRNVLPSVVTLPQYLQQNGYYTFGSGKVFHHPDPDSWNEYFPSLTENRPLPDPAPAVIPANGIQDIGNLDWAGLAIPDSEMSDAKVADWVVQELGSPQQQPFFLAAGIFRPHLPWYLPQSYFDGYSLAGIQLPPSLENDLDDVPLVAEDLATADRAHDRITGADKWDEGVRAYLAAIEFADRQVGRILDALDASPYAGNTIVVLIGDHGFHLGEKEHWRKATLWEESTRTPMIVRLPGLGPGLPPVTRTTSLLGIFPTIVELLALPPKPGLDGSSFANLLVDPPPPPVESFAVSTWKARNNAVRSEDFRYIEYSAGNGGKELYDRRIDPNEWTNLEADPSYDATEAMLAAHVPASAVISPGATTGLLVTRDPAGDLQLSWSGDCGQGTAFGVYRGDLGTGMSSLRQESCSVVGSSVTIQAGSGSGDFFLVVPNDGGREGSYGIDSTGIRRAPAASPCFAQVTIDACAP